jgi:hypothetical protein
MQPAVGVISCVTYKYSEHFQRINPVQTRTQVNARLNLRLAEHQLARACDSFEWYKRKLPQVNLPLTCVLD